MILFNDKILELKRFPNGEFNLEKSLLIDKITEEPGRNTITVKYESDDDLLKLLLIRKELTDFPLDLRIPYFPYSRMDRKSKSHAFTLKSVCEYINWLKFDKVILYEPHSDITPALLNNCEAISIIPQLLAKTPFNAEEDFIVYPDSSAYKRYTGLTTPQKELQAIKRRDFETGKINRIDFLDDIYSLEGKTIYIVDDLCSKGGTFMGAAKLIKGRAGEQGTTINLVIAHCEKTIFKGEIFTTDFITNVYTTDSILSEYTPTERLKVIPLEAL